MVNFWLESCIYKYLILKKEQAIESSEGERFRERPKESRFANMAPTRLAQKAQFIEAVDGAKDFYRFFRISRRGIPNKQRR
jgi:hypothetical protein